MSHTRREGRDKEWQLTDRHLAYLGLLVDVLHGDGLDRDASCRLARCVDLGCGHRVLDGWVGLDLRRYPGVGVQANLEHGLSFRSGSIDCLIASHVFEHVDSLVGVMAECHRVLRPGGYLLVRGPHGLSAGVWVDPTHRRGFMLHTFDYWEPESPFQYGFPPFRVVRRRLRFFGWNGFLFGSRLQRQLMDAVATVLEALANWDWLGSRLCERWWMHYVGGFNEVEILLERL